MTRQQAEQIPELQIKPDDLAEDCFYYLMAKAGKLSGEQGRKALARIEGKQGDPRYKGAFIVADMMMSNLDQYGVPCAEWCE